MTDEEMDRIENRLDFAERDGWDLLAALRMERAARLKAEAERDAARKQSEERLLSAGYWIEQSNISVMAAMRAGQRSEAAQTERDEALALLSRAREAFARWRAFQATFRADGKPPELKGPVADLAKILGTGE